MNPVKITERTLYPYIGKGFELFGWNWYQESSLSGKFPDLILEKDSTKVLIEVKIDTESKLLDAILDAYIKSRELGISSFMILLFPSSVREIPPSQLDVVFPSLELKAIMLTDWISDRFERIRFQQIPELLDSSYSRYLQLRTPKVSYELVVDTVRECIKELALIFRKPLKIPAFRQSALGMIGRFDLFQILLEEFRGEKIRALTQQEIEGLIADLAAYLLANQILFYHILSQKRGFPDHLKLPDVDPLHPLPDLIPKLRALFQHVSSQYPKILGFDLLQLLAGMKSAVIPISRMIAVIKPLHPEHISEDLLGRLYHETIPKETRKALGAFYTKPEAARLLALLSIDSWDEKVLDPACGSGTILVECYRRKSQLAPPMDPNQLHLKLISQIYGIDIMNFAFHMSCLNLASQQMFVPCNPNVIPRDGISAMLQAKLGNPHFQTQLLEWIQELAQERIPADFDVVIMNPPFTRRERLPEQERERIRRQIPQIRGKVGYWGYFIVAADNVLKPGGKLALVAPEGFFDQSGWSVREFLLRNKYSIKYAIKSLVEFFSEQAAFRDYLVVLIKQTEQDPKPKACTIILKKKLLELDIQNLATKIRQFSDSSDVVIDDPEFLGLKFDPEFISNYLRNLKPMIGLNSLEGYKLFLELLEKIKNLPTLSQLPVEIFAYNPGQYLGVPDITDYARKLFASRYGARAQSLVFNLEQADGDYWFVERRTRRKFRVSRSQIVPALRSYADVRFMDLTGREEAALIDPDAIPAEIRNITGMSDYQTLKQATQDIASAYQDHAGNILLGRKIRLNTITWMCYYSNAKILGPTSAFLNLKSDMESSKLKSLAVYLNSSVTLIQLLGLISEIEAGWVTLHEAPIWGMVKVPDIQNLPQELILQANAVFDSVSAQTADPMIQRLRQSDQLQNQIDRIALKMVGLDSWIPKLNQIHQVLWKELQILTGS